MKQKIINEVIQELKSNPQLRIELKNILGISDLEQNHDDLSDELDEIRGQI